MKPRLILVSLGLAALTILSFSLQAQEQPKASPNQETRDEIITSQQQLAQQWAAFQDALLRLKQRLARGTPEEKKRAEQLEAVLEECKNLSINQEFTKMVEVLRLAKFNSVADLNDAKERSTDLANKVRRILDLLQNSNSDHLTQKRKELEEIIKNIEKTITAQQTVEAQTGQGKTETKELANNQNKVKEKTDEIAKDLDKYLNKDKKGQGGEGAKAKGENKEGKGGEQGKVKDAGKEQANKGETKDGGKESQGAKGEAKPGDKGNKESPKGGQNEPKAGSKPGDKGKEGSPQAGSKENKGGQKGQEGGSKENKGSQKGQEGGAKDQGNKKEAGQQGTAKPGQERKQGGEQANKPNSEAKPGDKGPMDDKKASSKESKGGDKSSQAKAGGDPKNADSKQGEAKSGQAKSGEAKEGNPSQGGGDPKDAPPQAAQKGGGQQQQQQPPSGNKKDDDVAQSKKRVEEAGYQQKTAEEEILKKNNENALKKQAQAIKELEAAKAKLEKLLRQMREDELERVLAALQARCEKMLMMQIEVLRGTEDVHKAITKNADKKPNQENKRESLKLSDQEKLIVQEANKCIDILEAEGSAVAFPEVFQQVRQDMIHVQKRLELTDVADQTQAIEKDIIETLKEMIEALQKAQKDIDKRSEERRVGKECRSRWSPYH